MAGEASLRRVASSTVSIPFATPPNKYRKRVRVLICSATRAAPCRWTSETFCGWVTRAGALVVVRLLVWEKVVVGEMAMAATKSAVIPFKIVSPMALTVITCVALLQTIRQTAQLVKSRPAAGTGSFEAGS